MAKRRKKKKRRGHFCWCCARMRPNERFSRRGHRRHLCRDCATLGADELAYRQGVRDIDRLLGLEGRIRRKKRRELDRFLSHSHERVRDYAARVVAQDAEMRAADRRERIADEIAWVEWLQGQDADDPTWMVGHDPPHWRAEAEADPEWT